MDEVSGLYAVVDMSMKKERKFVSVAASKTSAQDIYATVDKASKSKNKASIFDEDREDNSIAINENLAFTDTHDAGRHKLKEAGNKTLCGKLVQWWIYGLIALSIFAIAVCFIALAVAFALIAGLRSEISAVKNGLNYRCHRLYINNEIFLNNSENQIMKISEDTSSKTKEIVEGIENCQNILDYYIILLNASTDRLLFIHAYLNNKIDEVFFNLSFSIRNVQDQVFNRVDMVDQNSGMLVNSTASKLANIIRSHHVFSSCNSIKFFDFPFLSGAYNIGTSASNSSLMNCSVYTASSCNGISGQWRRVVYIDTSKENMKCPGTLQALANPSSCRISGSQPRCSSVTFSSNNLPYSKVCGRIHAYYHGDPDGFAIFTTLRRASRNIDGNYMDGVSLTYGMGPRKHIWSFSATVGQSCSSCQNSPSFVESHYFCEFVTANPNTCPTYELWNGGNSCNDGDTFYRNLNISTSEDLEMRVCRDQDSNDEDILLSYVELFVSA